jgi:hypothetical protein
MKMFIVSKGTSCSRMPYGRQGFHDVVVTASEVCDSQPLVHPLVAPAVDPVHSVLVLHGGQHGIEIWRSRVEILDSAEGPAIHAAGDWGVEALFEVMQVEKGHVAHLLPFNGDDPEELALQDLKGTAFTPGDHQFADNFRHIASVYLIETMMVLVGSSLDEFTNRKGPTKI